MPFDDPAAVGELILLGVLVVSGAGISDRVFVNAVPDALWLGFGSFPSGTSVDTTVEPEAPDLTFALVVFAAFGAGMFTASTVGVLDWAVGFTAIFLFGGGICPVAFGELISLRVLVISTAEDDVFVSETPDVL